MGRDEDGATAVAEPLEAAIGRIPGVRAARVVASAGRVTEVHVIAGTDRSPKQLVRDVQSVAKATLDLDVDYRTVSIVQLEEASNGHLPAPAAKRLPLLRVVGSRDGMLATIEVALAEDGVEVTGRARGAAAEIPLLVARATLEAFAGRLDGSVAEIAGVERAEVAGRVVVVVVVRIVSAGGERLASGSALVGADGNDAVARATLDAVNRVP